jgi:NitT/TauT family transport system permease protein
VAAPSSQDRLAPSVATAIARGCPRLAIPVTIFLAIGAVWHLAVTTLRIPALLLPGPIAVFRSVIAEREILMHATAYTLAEIVVATTIAVTAGLATAVLFTMLPAIRRMVFPYILMTQVIPKVALAPILVAWFGIGIQSRLALAFLIAYFPMVINALTGLLGTPDATLQYARSLTASEMQVLLKVRLPAALPAIMAGMKITVGVAVIGVIVGEFVATDEGLGKVIIESIAALDTSLTVAATLAVGCLGLLLLGLVEVAESRVVYWRAGQ